MNQQPEPSAFPGKEAAVIRFLSFPTAFHSNEPNAALPFQSLVRKPRAFPPSRPPPGLLLYLTPPNHRPLLLVLLPLLSFSPS